MTSNGRALSGWEAKLERARGHQRDLQDELGEVASDGRLRTQVDMSEDGRTYIVRLMGPLGLVMPCRVVWTVDEPDRCGFAYGTLPGHPERKEESFVVERESVGDVTMHISAFGAPGTTLVRLAGPIPQFIQSLAARRYQQSLASLV